MALRAEFAGQQLGSLIARLSPMNIKEISIKYPSLCYTCTKARHPAAQENIEKGYVGCCMRLLTDDGTSTGNSLNLDYHEITKAKIVGIGWIRNSHIKGIGSGHLINGQIITREVSKCNCYQKM